MIFMINQMNMMIRVYVKVKSVSRAGMSGVEEHMDGYLNLVFVQRIITC